MVMPIRPDGHRAPGPAGLVRSRARRAGV